LRRPIALVVAALIVVVAIVFVAFAGTYVSYFIAAVLAQRAPENPFTYTCTQLEPPRGNSVLLRFDIANSGRKDATWMNFALHAGEGGGGNLSDWSYVLQTRVPAGGKVSKSIAVALNHDYRDVHFSTVRCYLINAVFADGSERSYGGAGDIFP